MLFLLAIIYPGGMGMGDVKMGGMLGAFLGPYAALAVFLGALAGAIAGGILMVTGKMPRRTALPFGVFMSLGGLVTLFVGPDLWGYYLDLVGKELRLGSVSVTFSGDWPGYKPRRDKGRPDLP